MPTRVHDESFVELATEQSVTQIVRVLTLAGLPVTPRAVCLVMLKFLDVPDADRADPHKREQSVKALLPLVERRLASK